MAKQVAAWATKRFAAQQKRADKSPTTHRHAGKAPRRQTTAESTKALLAELRRNSE